MEITGISGQSHGPGAEPILEGTEKGALGVLSPKLNIAYLSVNVARNFVQECSEDATKSVSLLHFHTPVGIISLNLPSTNLKKLGKSGIE